MARNLPLALSSEPLMKNDTVIGTMGKTQGVSSAANPHNMASMIIAQSEPPLVALSGADI